MAIVNIKIDTEHLGDTPKVQIDGKKIDVLDHIDFDWTTSQFSSLPSTSKLTIKRWPDYIHNARMNENLDFDRNEIVMQDITWKTASHE
ncbi:hypothetical protein HF865_03575 [Lactobacillus reuteri]|uniref:Uncharacterized protein n=1 Tax=Limosilactobacillus reuteri TaxID=1598 RepID=A0AAW9ZF88_LIMRT|nr:hypothetical protein [Limosilactobacillus reuteri]NME21791.1 hypothetical protein [Limosilactobacillus reuteri]